MDVTRAVVDDINNLLHSSRQRLLYDRQLRDSAQSIAANIREAYGRRAGAERNQFLRFAHGSAEESAEHLRANCAAKRVDAPRYWRLHNRLLVIMRMLKSLMGD